jgi:4-hydroxy-3-polyprenylbenzoate decarboxylase
LPQSVDDLVNMIVGRVLDLLDIEHDLHDRWSGKSPLTRDGQEEAT